MWTPKRILLLISGLAIFLLSFAIYATFLGWIDSVPPLPEKYARPMNPGEIPEIIDPDEPEADRKLRIAFGNDCPEIERTIKVEVKKKHLAFATDQTKFQDDGRVLFKPFSIAIFGKEELNGFPEINTVRADEAYLTFDRPISNPTDIGNRKIIGAELRGAITVINNRRTPVFHDDVEVYIINGPLYFHSDKNMIWSDSFVKLLDKHAQPHPTQVTAIGLDIYLSKDSNINAANRPVRDEKNKNVSGVDEVVLRTNVDMRLHIDAKSGFLAGTNATEAFAKADAPAKKSESSHVTIKTLGRFSYNVQKDLAIFESPPANNNQEKPRPFPSDQVEVIRIHKQEDRGQLRDQLLCDRLELQFRKKKSAQNGIVKQDDQSGSREIDSAKATAFGNREVTLSLDSENLNAHGTELIYLSATEHKGPQSILRGEPMIAIKDAHRIRSKELHLIAANKEGEGQHAYAKGPVQIDLVDQNDINKKQLYHAVCRDSLVVTKAKHGNQILDRLTFTGDAGFIDDGHKQELHAEKLEVWLEPAERERLNDPNKEKKHRASEAPRQQPLKLEGFGKVRVSSPDLSVKNCEHLLVRFKDGPSSQLPEILPTAGVGSDLEETKHVSKRSNTVNLPPIKVSPPPSAALGSNDKVTVRLQPDSASKRKNPLNFGGGENRSRNPIELSARYVTVDLLRGHSQHELKEIFTRGDVHVHQKPSTDKNNGVDIRGETLNLLHSLEGDTLIVFGDTRGPAELRLGEMVVVGPKVTIDQRENIAEVKGIGAMQLPSDTTFEGGRPTEPGTKLVIHWTKDMFFNGQTALFQGGVQAYQNESSLRCQTLQVSLDKSVSFKEGQQSGQQGAKVSSLVCHSQVDIVDTKKDADDKLVRYERLLARQLTMDNQQGPAIATGPGRVSLLQHGTVAVSPGASENAKKNAKEKKLHLTRVDFNGRLFTTKRENIRVAKFYTDVKVFHVPTEQHNINLDPDKLPDGGLFLRCDLLTIQTQEATKNQTIFAEENVQFKTREFSGQADKLVYDQKTEMIFFEGKNGNMVTLYKSTGRGNRPEMTRAGRIMFNRRTGEFHIDRGQSIDASTR